MPDAVAPEPDAPGRRPRVLLVEDDASIRRFVELALEDSGVDLVQAATLASAIQALRSGPFKLVLCDLMLPDGSGVDLLRSLGEADSPSPRARRVAFSAGVGAETRKRLQSCGVHEVLSKPVSVAGLLDCVQAAVRSEAAGDAGLPEGAAREQTAVEVYFGGDLGLYEAFLAQCRLQWRADAASGDAALAGGDLAALRRLAHSLKTVLQTVGMPHAGALAQDIEAAAAEGQQAAAQAGWTRLRAQLLGASGPGAR